MKTLKNILSLRWLLLIIVATSLSASLAACSDDDDDDDEANNNSIPALLCGSWEPSYEECWKNGEMVKTKYPRRTWIFSPDGILVWKESDRSFSGSIVIKDNRIVGTMHKANGDWWANLNEEIIKLTESDLILKSPYPDYEYDYTMIYLSRVS